MRRYHTLTLAQRWQVVRRVQRLNLPSCVGRWHDAGNDHRWARVVLRLEEFLAEDEVAWAAWGGERLRALMAHDGVSGGAVQ